MWDLPRSVAVQTRPQSEISAKKEKPAGGTAGFSFGVNLNIEVVGRNEAKGSLQIAGFRINHLLQLLQAHLLIFNFLGWVMRYRLQDGVNKQRAMIARSSSFD